MTKSKRRQNSRARLSHLLLVWAGGIAAVGIPLARADELPNRVAAGDVTTTSAVLWARASVAGELRFDLGEDSGFAEIQRTITVTVDDVHVPAKIDVDGLTAATQYFYRATDAAGRLSAGTFRTPHVGERAGLHFGVSGDSRGDLAPYPSVSNVPGRDLDLFIALGDTIYADVPSPAFEGPQAETLEEFRAKQDEVYGERFGLNTLGELRASTALLAMIDDHEVTNDFAGAAPVGSDPRFDTNGVLLNDTDLFSNGLQAFVEYHPIRDERYGDTGETRSTGKRKLYRTRTYGRDAAFFMVDARSFRDEPLEGILGLASPAVVDAFLAASFDPNRTLLGEAQFAELTEDLRAADDAGVTWKFIILPEPIQNLSPILASDRYEGYAYERSRLLRFIAELDIPNVVFIAADIHGTMINNLTYQDDAGSPQIATRTFEITTGPIAYAAPFGPTVVDYIDPASFGFAADVFKSFYFASGPTLQDGLVAWVGDILLDTYGYDPVGLDGSPIDARLESGGYVAVNYYGWSEFNIDAATQQLTVTTWGIDWYSPEELAANRESVLAREPRVLNRFTVTPDCTQLDAPCGSAPAACGAIGVIALAWIPLGWGLRFVRRRRRRTPTNA